MNKKREQKDVSSIFFTNIHEFAQTTKQMFSLNSYSELNTFIILQHVSCLRKQRKRLRRFFDTKT